MRAGRLRHRVLIEENNPTTDNYGGKTDNWQRVVDPYGEVWAAVEPLSARELIQAQQVNAEATIRGLMRYWDGLTTQHRLRHNGRVLEILSIVNRDDRNIQIELMCKEAV